MSGENFIAVGIDPGVTTGVAIYSNGVLCGCETTTYAEVADILNQYLPDVVIIENFHVRLGKPSLYHPSIRLIGVVEYLCQILDIEFIIQSPSILVSMMRILPKGISSPHVRAATCHLGYYFQKVGKNCECFNL